MARKRTPDKALKESGGVWARLRSWYRSKAPILRFGVKFCGLIGLFYLLSLAPTFQRVFAAAVEGDAAVSGALLNHLGEHVTVTGGTIASPRYAISVVAACSAIEYTWFFCAALLAFPAPWLRKAAGIVVGVALLMALNLVRIMSLFLIGAHFPGLFEAAHEEIWGIVLVIAELCLCVAWIGWARPRDTAGTHVAA